MPAGPLILRCPTPAVGRVAPAAAIQPYQATRSRGSGVPGGP